MLQLLSDGLPDWVTRLSEQVEIPRLAYVNFQPWREIYKNGVVCWELDSLGRQINGLPQIFWGGGKGWAEVNHWALEKAVTPGIKLKTVISLMKHLYTYAKYLAAGKLDWRHFPIRKDERSVIRFRGYLIDRIERGTLKSRTASACINAVIQFYRHAEAHGFVFPETPMWRERSIVISYYDLHGFKRAMTRVKTDLAIPSRYRHGVTLEDGLLPLSELHMEQLIKYARQKQTEEMNLMLSLGFFTGARIGTISTLRIENLEQAAPDPYIRGVHLICVGPGTGVETKNDVSGDLLVPDGLLAALKAYASSVERLKREMKAKEEQRSTLFLTIRGRPYSGQTNTRLMTDLRRDAISSGLRFMANFKFHQTRATFGTWLMKLALEVTTVAGAIEFVKSAMLHKDESSTLRYVKFLEVTKGKQAAAAAYNEMFTGLYGRNWDEFDA